MKQTLSILCAGLCMLSLPGCISLTFEADLPGGGQAGGFGGRIGGTWKWPPDEPPLPQGKASVPIAPAWLPPGGKTPVTTAP